MEHDENAEATLTSLAPDRPITRSEFIAKAKNLLDQMAEDHEEQTGIDDVTPRPWDEWMHDLYMAYINE
jgi:hypothetical protein